MAASQPHRALIFHSISNTRLDGHEQLNKEAGDASMTKTQENNMMFTIRISGEEWEGDTSPHVPVSNPSPHSVLQLSLPRKEPLLHVIMA